MCSVGDDGSARCDCEGEWSGLECNQRWHAIDIPPFVEDLAFDADGNGWFATTQGLLFWDFAATLLDTADDSWQLFREFKFGRDDIQSVVIDSSGVKWVLAGRLYRLDDNGTPSSTADDVLEEYELTDWRSLPMRRIVLDREDRLWALGQVGMGVKLLPAAELQAGPPPLADPAWVSLFATEVVRDVAADGEGVWVAAESGLYYVSLGDTLDDEIDDVWTDFSEVPALGGEAVTSIELEPASDSVWFNTAGGIVHLTHAGDPSNEATNSWVQWAPDVEIAQGLVEIGPVIAAGTDGAVWLRSPHGAAVRVAEAESGDDDVTRYHPASCPEYAAPASIRRVRSLVVDEGGDKWLTWGDSFLHLDDGGTATDTSDDRWTRFGRALLSESILELFPVGDGGVWLKSHRSHGTSTPGCSGDETLYYFDVGAFSNGLDDAWIPHPVNEDVSSCFELLGPDKAGHLWVKDQPPQRYDGAWYLLDVGATPGDPSDDTWVAWTEADAPAFSARVAAIDPLFGLWIEEELFGYGDSLSDASDDSWWTLGAHSPRAVALDARGGRWFGYDSPVLRYLDDGGTAELPTDDRWDEYSTSEGLPVQSIRDLQLDGHGDLWVLGNRFDEEPQLCKLAQFATPADYSEELWACFTTSDGLGSPWVEVIAVTAAGHAWVGTRAGLEYLELDR